MKILKFHNIKYIIPHNFKYQLTSLYKYNNKSFSIDVTHNDDTNNEITTDSQNYNISLHNIYEPEEYRSVYLQNLSPEWTEEEVKVRLEQVGAIEKLHLIKNSIGENTGNIIAVYQNIENVSHAINAFKDKLPFDQVTKVRFYRKYDNLMKLLPPPLIGQVLKIKNIHEYLIKEDLKLFLSEFAEPIYIGYPRDRENEFRRMAFVYFKSKEDAEKVIKNANLRYINNKQLYIRFALKGYYDITDFRTRIEQGVKIQDKRIELYLFNKQILYLESLIELKKKTGHVNKLDIENEFEKLEYLRTRHRQIEKQVSFNNHQIDGQSLNQLENKSKFSNRRLSESVNRINKKILNREIKGGESHRLLITKDINVS
jgi:uncharacterized protein YneR